MIEGCVRHVRRRADHRTRQRKSPPQSTEAGRLSLRAGSGPDQEHCRNLQNVNFRLCIDRIREFTHCTSSGGKIWQLVQEKGRFSPVKFTFYRAAEWRILSLALYAHR
jgi:hypothetical protein